MFETGAKTQPANDLTLSVLNDSAVYDQRKKAGYSELNGEDRYHVFREICSIEAAKQRKAFGSKFNLSDIAESAKLVRKASIDHCLECLAGDWTGETIVIDAYRWFDRINGNSYFSARISIPTHSGARYLNIPFQYGYGNQWQWEALGVLRAIGFTFPKNALLPELPLSMHDHGYTKKSAMFGGVYITPKGD